MQSLLQTTVDDETTKFLVLLGFGDPIIAAAQQERGVPIKAGPGINHERQKSEEIIRVWMSAGTKRLGSS